MILVWPATLPRLEDPGVLRSPCSCYLAAAGSRDCRARCRFIGAARLRRSDVTDKGGGGRPACRPTVPHAGHDDRGEARKSGFRLGPPCGPAAA